MKKKFTTLYLTLILLLGARTTIMAQTTETFESSSVGATSFTSNSVLFTLSGGIKISEYITYGYLSSNRYIDSFTSGGTSFCKLTSGTAFRVKSLYLYPSVYADGNTNQTSGVNVMFTGKLGGTTKFTYTPPSSDFTAARWSNTTNRGFSLVNFATPGYDNTTIDELDITLGGGAVYCAIDNYTWAVAPVTPIAPTVTTQAVSSITSTTVTGNGNITALGVPNPTAYGLCWNTTGTPTISDNKVDKGAASATGAFTASITSLSANTTYYVRAYATNTAGTSYGIDMSFTTLLGTENSSPASSNSAIYPNQTTDSFKANGLSGKTLLTIYNLTGQILFSKEVDNNEAVDVSGFGVGVYVVKVDGKELKLIKNN